MSVKKDVLYRASSQQDQFQKVQTQNPMIKKLGRENIQVVIAT